MSAKGKNYTEVNDWISNFDPRVTGLAAKKGALFRYIPVSGLPRILIKNDSGFSTDWSQVGVDSQPFVYYVTPGVGDLPTIQSAIDKAFADGSGSNGHIASIFVPPGTYTENLIFKAGQNLIAQSSQVAVGAVNIVGQHSYTPDVNSDPLAVLVGLQGFSFINTINGHTISFLGPNGALFSIAGCSFIKQGSGNCIFGSNPGAILVIANTSTTSNQGTDVMIDSDCFITVLNGASYSDGSPNGMLIYRGAGFVTLSQTQSSCNGPFVIDILSGFVNATYNTFVTGLADADCVRIAAGASMNLVHSSLSCPTGTGYVMQGNGTVNGSMLVYFDNNIKDPGLTFNLLSSDP